MVPAAPDRSEELASFLSRYGEKRRLKRQLLDHRVSG